MKPFKKFMLLTSCALGIFALAACGSNQKQSKEKQASSTVQQSHSDKEHYKGTYSNLNSKESVEEVRALLSAYLDQDSVDKFMGLVTDYDSIVGSVGLTGDFSTFKKTEYDVEKISDLWTKQKGDFVGTNCRINSYTLLKNRIEIPKMKADSELLFVDNDAIDKGKVFDEAEKEGFNILYSRVPTEATTDVKVHAKKMEEYFANFKFNENARMLSVIVHDNLDGNTLFVGHVGVLVPAKEGYLFVEKLTFEEPYQAIKFATKEDVYKYLETKYQDYTGEGLAKPFIMDNEKWVETKQNFQLVKFDGIPAKERIKMNKKLTYVTFTLILIGFLLVEASMYVLPYIEGLKELELVAFGFGIFLLVAVIILLTKTKKHTD